MDVGLEGFAGSTLVRGFFREASLVSLSRLRVADVDDDDDDDDGERSNFSLFPPPDTFEVPLL
jgi:hypothetical protein